MTTTTNQTPEQREAALKLAKTVKKVVDDGWEGSLVNSSAGMLADALLDLHAENVRLREALEGILCAGAHAHDGSEAEVFPCFKCLLVNHVNAALSGSPATED